MGNIECCQDDLKYDGEFQMQKHLKSHKDRRQKNQSDVIKTRKSLISDYSMSQTIGSKD